MGRKKKESNIKSVMYSYVGTDDQFDHFLKMMIHDYLSVDDPYTNQPADSVGKVENEVAWFVLIAIQKLVCYGVSWIIGTP